jgi:hypothetical protein
MLMILTSVVCLVLLVLHGLRVISLPSSILIALTTPIVGAVTIVVKNIWKS